MVKWKNLCEFEKDFDRVDFGWREHRFYVNDKFKFPDERLHLNLDAMRSFANGVGHFITASKFDSIIKP